ncbi:hypothetical protein J1605_009202 [Eschrichtius robustus]|uniref:Uncharacterized protein n=1 Tax=Eschrichtius robustus TaxID=9764 RepID=A0AB34GSK9_ESCRO|nr:hypothetical protein J1605_009202 [Eschrichtius robustus]
MRREGLFNWGGGAPFVVSVMPTFLGGKQAPTGAAEAVPPGLAHRMSGCVWRVLGTECTGVRTQLRLSSMINSAQFQADCDLVPSGGSFSCLLSTDVVSLSGLPSSIPDSLASCTVKSSSPAGPRGS